MNAIVETINGAGKAFVDFALAMLVQSSVLIAILLLVDWVLHKRVRAVFRYWIWMLVLAKLVLPPSLGSPVSIGRWLGDPLRAPTAALSELGNPPPVEPADEPHSLAADVLSQSIPASMIDPYPEAPYLPAAEMHAGADTESLPGRAAPLPAASLGWQGLVLLSWAAVALCLLLLLLQRSYFVRGLVAQADEASAAMEDSLDHCWRRMGLRQKVGLRLSAIVGSPAACGLIHPVILVPQNLVPRLQSHDLQAVLLHELAHIKRGDLWVNLVQTLAQIVYFYNPLLWLANAIIRRTREQAVDEAVLVAMGEAAQQYPETLVNVAKLAFRKRPALSLRLIGVVESKSALSARIRHILSRPLPKSTKVGVAGLIVILVTATVLLPMAKAQRREAGGIELRLALLPDCGVWLSDVHGQDLPVLDLASERIILLPMVKSDYDLLQTTTSLREGDVLYYYDRATKTPKITFLGGAGFDDASDSSKVVTRTIIPSEIPWEATVVTRRNRRYEIRIIQADEHGCAIHFRPLEPMPSAPKAILPDGVTVELVGASEHPSAGKPWWRPDGSSLEEPPYDQIGGTVRADEDRKAYELAIRLRNLPVGAETTVKTEPAGSSAGGGSPPKREGQSQDDLRWLATSLPKDLRTCTVLCGIAAGEWQTLAQSEGQAARSQGMAAGGVSFSPATESADKGVAITVTDDMIDRPSRIIAATTDGRTITSWSAQTSSVGKARQTTAYFRGVTLAQIAEFRFETRSWTWVEFRDVSLRPGQRTSVKVRIQADEARKDSAALVLPEADRQPVVLDLATGELVPLPPAGPDPQNVQQALRNLGKGDLLYDCDMGDRTLILVRDATSEQAKEDTGEPSITGYLIGPQLPEALTVTTAEGRQYEVTILAADDKACTLKYSPVAVGRGAGGAAPVEPPGSSQLTRRQGTALIEVNPPKVEPAAPEPPAKLANGTTVRFLAYSEWRNDGLNWWTSGREPTTLPGVVEADIEGLGTVLAFQIDPPQAEVSASMPRGAGVEDFKTIWQLGGSGTWLFATGNERSYANVSISTLVRDPPVVGLIPLTGEDQGKVVEVNKFGVAQIVDLQVIQPGTGKPEDGAEARPPVMQFTVVKSPISSPSVVAVEDKEGLAHELSRQSDSSRAATYRVDLWPEQLAFLVTEASLVRQSHVQFRNICVGPGRVTKVQVETDPTPTISWFRSKVNQALSVFADAIKQYLKDQHGQLPVSLEGMKGYLPEDNWLTEHLAYIAKSGRVPSGGSSVIVAYDKTLLPQGKGTYVVYASIYGGSVQFKSPKQLAELGIPSEAEAQRRLQPSESGSGQPSSGGKPSGQPDDTLKRLIDEAQPGGIVTIPKGRYTTSVEITKAVVLRGESQEGCVIEVTADQPAVLVKNVAKGNVTIENLTIRWQLATDARIERPVALLVKDTNALIRNCRFVPLGDSKRSPVAVYIDGRSKSTVDNCRFSEFDYTICYGQGTEGVVQDCVITDCGHQGVINYDGATLTVQRNIITGSKFHAVRCTGGTLNVKDNLLIKNANRGIYLGNKTGRGTITNNLIVGNGTGISGFGRADYAIANNVIVDNEYAGIDMRDSCRLSIRNNVLAKNQRGLALFKEGTEDYNVIAKNTYWANATDVENMDKPQGSVTADPQFPDPNHGDFSVRGPVQEQGHGLTNPQVLKDLWKRYEQLKTSSGGASQPQTTARDATAPVLKDPSGRVVDPSGKPVAAAQVALCTKEKGVVIQAGQLAVSRWGGKGSDIVQTDEQGRFSFARAPAEFHLVAAHASGFAWVTYKEFASSGDLRLQPWGRIEGTVRIGREPGADKRVSLLSAINKNAIDQNIRYDYQTQTDAGGQFVLKEVPPAWMEVGYMTRVGDNTWSDTCRTPLQVQPGQSVKMMLGGTGRPVIGKFVPPADYKGAVYFGAGLRALATWRPDPPKPANYEQMTKSQQQQWLQQWFKTPEAEAFYDAIWHDLNRRHYTFRINEEGLFRIEDVTTGKYQVTVYLEERLGAGRPEEIGGYSGTIDVPAMTQAYTDEPLDLGELTLTMHKPLHVGDVAPPFGAKTLDGKDINLADYRGKFVLLSFWQPEYHPELDRLKELYKTYGGTGKLQIIGLGGGDTPEEIKKYITEHKIEWPEVYFGEKWDEGIAAEYGLSGLPYILLVNPEGKIVATWLREEKLTETVRAAIDKPR